MIADAHVCPLGDQVLGAMEVAEQRRVVQRYASHEVRGGSVLNHSHEVPIDRGRVRSETARAEMPDIG